MHVTFASNFSVRIPVVLFWKLFPHSLLVNRKLPYLGCRFFLGCVCVDTIQLSANFHLTVQGDGVSSPGNGELSCAIGLG